MDSSKPSRFLVLTHLEYTVLLGFLEGVGRIDIDQGIQGVLKNMGGGNTGCPKKKTSLMFLIIPNKY